MNSSCRGEPLDRPSRNFTGGDLSYLVSLSFNLAMHESKHNRNIWRGVAAGAIGGLAGSFAMNRFQAVWSGVSQDEEVTAKAAEAVSRHVFGHELTSPEKTWAVPAVHYGLGTILGALYGALAEKVPSSRAGYGTAYGSAIWLMADEIAAPALGLAQSAAETPLSSHLNALASHLVYGLVTDRFLGWAACYD
jgi:putative membrane protein